MLNKVCNIDRPYNAAVLLADAEPLTTNPSDAGLGKPNASIIAPTRTRNGLKNNNLKAGQRLKVPKGKEKVENVSSSVTHTVRSGESLYLIAEHYGVTVNAIKNANNLSGNSIKPGQKLTIPKKSASKNTSRSKAKSSKKKK